MNKERVEHIFNKANKEKFAIPSTNFIDSITLKAYLEAAKEKDLPLILSIAEVHLQYIDFLEAFNLAKMYIKKYDLEDNVILHLDHGTDIELIKQAIDLGFNSVMIDASFKTFDENIKLTKEVVEYAHKKGVFVEAEIGHVGSGEIIGLSCSDTDKNIYTTVEDAKQFYNQTSVDTLAISIGTTHGKYKGEPKINFSRLEEIKRELNIPLVLHGGSSTGYMNLNECVKLGINKINLYTDFIIEAQNINSKEVDYYTNQKNQINKIKNKLIEYYEVFGTKKV